MSFWENATGSTAETVIVIRKTSQAAGNARVTRKRRREADKLGDWPHQIWRDLNAAKCQANRVSATLGPSKPSFIHSISIEAKKQIVFIRDTFDTQVGDNTGESKCQPILLQVSETMMFSSIRETNANGCAATITIAPSDSSSLSQCIVYKEVSASFV